MNYAKAYNGKNHIDQNINPVTQVTYNRVGDWNCKGCNFLIFGSKDKCFKCNLDKEGNPVTNNKYM